MAVYICVKSSTAELVGTVDVDDIEDAIQWFFPLPVPDLELVEATDDRCIVRVRGEQFVVTTLLSIIN